MNCVAQLLGFIASNITDTAQSFALYEEEDQNGRASRLAPRVGTPLAAITVFILTDIAT